MTKWLAKINEDDSIFGEEVYLGIAGGECGFEVVLSTEEDSGVMPGMTEEEARENLEDYYGYYDSFVWLDSEE